MTRKKAILALILYFSILSGFSQRNDEKGLTNVFRINFLSPGFGYDMETSSKFLLSTDLGIGYSGAFDEITLIENDGFQYVIAPFLNIQYKYIYNRSKRNQKGKSMDFNSGNFFSIRARGRGPSIAENFTRTDDMDFLIGPTWGIQRSLNKYHYLIDFGPTYYFDTLGNGGFFPINLQIKFGLNLSSKK